MHATSRGRRKTSSSCLAPSSSSSSAPSSPQPHKPNECIDSCSTRIIMTGHDETKRSCSSVSSTHPHPHQHKQRAVERHKSIELSSSDCSQITILSVFNVIITMLGLIKSTSIGSDALLTAKRRIFRLQQTFASSRLTTNIRSQTSSFSSSSSTSLTSFRMANKSAYYQCSKNCKKLLHFLALIATILFLLVQHTSATIENAQNLQNIDNNNVDSSESLLNFSDIILSNYESTTTTTTTTTPSTTTTRISSDSTTQNSVSEPEIATNSLQSPPLLQSTLLAVADSQPNPFATSEHVCGSVDIRNSIHQFSKLENCTVIEGHLQIVLFDNGTVKDFENVTFPKLREITDYFLIFRIMGLQTLARLFPNLAVIRGRRLLHDYAFVVYEMLQLQEIGLHSLQIIERGDVRIEKNPNLCYVNTIDWRSIARNALITENKDADNCPMCPRHCPRTLTDESSSRVCWTGEICQRLPCAVCEKFNRTCSATGQCCPEQCLGGCEALTPQTLSTDTLDVSRNDNPLTCVACRKYRYANQCYDRCPEGTYQFYGRRCVSKEECTAKNDEDIAYKAFDNKCEATCPVGYTENVTNPHECYHCGEACPKICQSSVVSNIASAQSLKGCTIINGSLEIAIQSVGAEIFKELGESLKDLKEITEYLKISRSFPLISLDFLQSLETIRGQRLERGHYALFILDNANLQELWTFDPKKKSRRISVPNGRIFIHLNPKLCYSKIEKLSEYMDFAKAKTPWDERDVSRLSNGDRVPCEVAPLDVKIWGVRPMVVVISFENFKRKLEDRRGLLGYLIYYREAPHKNVSIFDGRDACSRDEWNVVEFDDVDGTEPTHESNDDDATTTGSSNDTSINQIMTPLPAIHQHIIPNLKPFTQYALYIKTYMIASESKGAQSEIIYFKTKPDTPSRPRNIFSKATKPDEILVKWEPPSEPNGEVTRYIVRATKDEVVEQARDFCSESKGVSSSKSKKEKKIPNEPVSTSHWMANVTGDALNSSANNISLQAFLQAGKCCTCKADRINAQDKEQKIEFEDYIINTVYVKRTNFPLSSSSSQSGNSSQRRRRELVSNYSVSTESSQDPSSTTITTTIVPGSTTPEVPKKWEFLKQVFHQLSIIIPELEHFSEYTIKVQACQNPEPRESRDMNRDPCSVTAVTSIRTLPLPGADDIEQSSLVYQFDNSTSKDSGTKLSVVFVSWREPANPNGYILSYQLEYQLFISEQKQGHPTLRCVSRDAYAQRSGIDIELSPGNYSLRIRARSLADFGNWTAPINVFIEEPSHISFIFWIILFSICVPLLIALVVSLYLLRLNRAKLDYISVNPEYVSAGMYYEPDPRWEIERDCVKLLKALGQGSFGMVYRGELKISTSPNIMPCAVKTLNENASPRSKVDFLKEADIMKSFTDCHHVVKLLGIVSATQPVYVLMEIMSLGDLRKYLRGNRLDNEEAENPTPPPEELLLRFAIQIADGMAYLASKKFVHRDLAARNCMINEELTVKIGDFGMTRDIYETDYYRKGGKGLLPVRWMSPESLKDGLFTTHSDVWSYGIVLWEMATLAAQPYPGLSNEGVLKFVSEGGKMTRPKECSDILWTLMDQTWAWKAKSRPNFLKIVDFLLDFVERDSFLPVSYYWQWRIKNKNKSTSSNGNIPEPSLDELIPLNRLESQDSHGDFTDGVDENAEEDDGDDEPIKFFPLSQPIGSNMKIFEDLKNSENQNAESSGQQNPVVVINGQDNDDDQDDDEEDEDQVALAKSESLSSTSTSEPGSPSSRDSGLNFVQHDESLEESQQENVLMHDKRNRNHNSHNHPLPGSFPSDASGLSRNSSVVESQNSSPGGSDNNLSSTILNGHLMNNTSTSIV